MKKILFGLIATSMVSFATSPTLSNDPTENTNIFQIGQQGKITVNENLSSDVAPVKYVVYASTDGNYDGTTGETWEIPTWIISASLTPPTGIGPNGSMDTSSLPKIYVKRINNDNNGVMDLGASEIAKFKLQLPADYNQDSELADENGIGYYITSGHTNNISPFSFFSKATLRKILTEIGTTSTVVQGGKFGGTKAITCLFSDMGSGGYIGGAYFCFEVKDSVLSLVNFSWHTLNNDTYLADAEKVDSYFATERSISPEVAILVQIETK